MVARATARKRKGRAAAGWTQLRLEEPAPLPVLPPIPAGGGAFVAALIADLAAELGTPRTPLGPHAAWTTGSIGSSTRLRRPSPRAPAGSRQPGQAAAPGSAR